MKMTTKSQIIIAIDIFVGIVVLLVLILLSPITIGFVLHKVHNTPKQYA